MSDRSARIRGTTASIDNAAKQLRKTLTTSEQQLWQALSFFSSSPALWRSRSRSDF